MARLWKVVDGEPYMINPRLGVLALQALNPKRGKRNMASKHSRRHMAWVRSFRRKGNRSHHRKHRRSNPYPMGGAVAALNPRHRYRKHRKSNPGGITSVFRGGLGLPPIMTVVWGGLGFVATAMLQGFIDTLVPATWKTNTDGTPSLMVKYSEIAAGIIGVTWGGKMIFGRGPASLMGIGGGVYAAQQAAHDFLPGVIPGMHAYTPLKAYTPLNPSGLNGVVMSAGGAFPQLASRASLNLAGLRAPDQGFRNSPNFAEDGGMMVVQERYRRF